MRYFSFLVAVVVMGIFAPSHSVFAASRATLKSSESQKIALSLRGGGDLKGGKGVNFRFEKGSQLDIEACGGDWSEFKVLEFKLEYPSISMANYRATEQMELIITDQKNRKYSESYPFTNIPWMFDKRPIVPWSINLNNYRDSGVQLDQIKSATLKMSGGNGEVLIHDIRLHAPTVVMDLTRALEPESVIYDDTKNGRSEEGKIYWGSSIIKDQGLYHRYTAYWFRGDHWWTGAIDYHTSKQLIPADNYKYHGAAITKEGNEWGTFAHNPDIFRDKDGTYYMYYLSGGNERSRTIALAYADSPSGEWHYVKEPILTVAEHGKPNYEEQRGAKTYGIGNPRMVYKDGKYYLFHKILANFRYPEWFNKEICNNGKLGYLLYYDLAVADSPRGPFKKVEITGLRGRSTNYQLYIDCGMKKPGNWDVEDGCFFEYKGMHYAVTKDFMGYWNRSGKLDGLVLWESEDLINWRVSDFPLITKEVRKMTFKDMNKNFSKMERPYLFIDEDGESGVMTFAVYQNMMIPFKFKE